MRLFIAMVVGLLAQSVWADVSPITITDFQVVQSVPIMMTGMDHKFVFNNRQVINTPNDIVCKQVDFDVPKQDCSFYLNGNIDLDNIDLVHADQENRLDASKFSLTISVKEAGNLSSLINQSDDRYITKPERHVYHYLLPIDVSCDFSNTTGSITLSIVPNHPIRGSHGAQPRYIRVSCAATTAREHDRDENRKIAQAEVERVREEEESKAADEVKARQAEYQRSVERDKRIASCPKSKSHLMYEAQAEVAQGLLQMQWGRDTLNHEDKVASVSGVENLAARDQAGRLLVDGQNLVASAMGKYHQLGGAESDPYVVAKLPPRQDPCLNQ